MVEIILSVGPTLGPKKKGSYASKANCGVLNKCICLSIYFDVDEGQDQSFIFCNGKKLATFTSYSTDGAAPLEGDIALFLLYRHKMTESDILLHHKSINL